MKIVHTFVIYIQFAISSFFEFLILTRDLSLLAQNVHYSRLIASCGFSRTADIGCPWRWLENTKVGGNEFSWGPKRRQKFLESLVPFRDTIVPLVALNEYGCACGKWSIRLPLVAVKRFLERCILFDMRVIYL